MSCSKKSLEENHLDEKIDFVEFIKSTQKLDLCDTESCQSLTSKHSNEEKLKYPFEKEEVMKDYRKFSEDTIRVGKIINPKKLFKSSKTCSVFNAIESIDGKETSESKRYSNSNPGILNEENDNIVRLSKIDNNNTSTFLKKDEGKKNKSGCCQKGVTKVGSEKRYSNHHAPMKTMHTVDHEDGSIEAYFTEDITYNK
uniref:Protein CUSTOS n=1 Tax=Strongyloides stercoralis TaxID=6248 RepID=A0A0K0EIQ3_STRER